jgi:hypothetical protein
MYCANCGVAVSKDLSYCQRCGAKQMRDEQLVTSREVKPELLIRAMVTTFVFGLVAMTILMGVMKVTLGLAPGQILALLIVPLAAMLALEGVFVRLLTRGSRGLPAAPDSKPLREQITNELEAPRTRALPDSMPSVTEDTTRTFEPNYIERNSK